MTTETLPEVTTPLTPEPELESQAPPTQASDGTEPSPPPSDLDADALLGDFLKAQGYEAPTQTAEVQNSDVTAPKTETGTLSADEIAEYRSLKAQTEASRQASLTVDYRNRAAWVRQALGQLQSGQASLTDIIPQSNPPVTYAQAIGDQFDAHHAQSSRVLSVEWNNALTIEAANLLPESERRAFFNEGLQSRTLKDVVEKISGVARKGYVSEGDATKREKASYAKGASEAKAFFQEKGLLPGSKAPAADNGSVPANYGSLTPDQIDRMPTNEWLAIGASDTDGGRARRQQIRDTARARR